MNPKNIDSIALNALTMTKHFFVNKLIMMTQHSALITERRLFSNRHLSFNFNWHYRNSSISVLSQASDLVVTANYAIEIWRDSLKCSYFSCLFHVAEKITIWAIKFIDKMTQLVARFLKLWNLCLLWQKQQKLRIDFQIVSKQLLLGIFLEGQEIHKYFWIQFSELRPK